MKKIKIIQKVLNFLFPNPKIPLYYKNNFTLLISIILSQKSKDNSVNIITKKLFQTVNDPYDIKNMKLKKLKNIIKPLGLHNKKSKNLKLLSNILINKYNNKIPKNFKILKKLPGVGQKTASIIFNKLTKQHTFPVDTHINKYIYKWRLTKTKNIKSTEKIVKKIFPKNKWNKISLQIIYYGKFYLYTYNNKKNDIITEILKLYKKKIIKI